MSDTQIIREYQPVTYTPKTWDQIFATLLDNAFREGLLSDDRNFTDYILQKKNIENDLILTLSNVATILTDSYNEVTKAYNSKDLSKAREYDLDVLGWPFFERIPADFAVTDLTFRTEDPAPYDIPIPVGTKVKHESDDSIIFETIENGVMVTGMTELTIKARCTRIGEMGNVPPDMLTEMVIPIGGIDSVTNELMSSGGVNSESDDNYRERLSQWRWIMQRGTYNAVVDSITRVPSVTGYYIEPYWMGYGTALLVVDPPTESVLEMVNNELEMVKAVDEEWTVKGVELVPVDASFVINVTLDETVPMSAPEQENTRLAVENYVRTYLDGGIDAYGSKIGPIPIGRDFVPFEVGKFVSEQVTNIRNFEAEYPKEPVTILPYQRATSGEINITVV